jgi:hypothetical protein
MAVIAQAQRMAELQRLGLSAPLVRLATGECVHEAFRASCLGPAFYVYHGADAPAGPPLIPLWDSGESSSWTQPPGNGFRRSRWARAMAAACCMTAIGSMGRWGGRFGPLVLRDARRCTAGCLRFEKTRAKQTAG